MSLLDAPPPPLPDQKVDPGITTDTPPSPRGDAKQMDVHANIRREADEVALRQADARAREANADLEQREAAKLEQRKAQEAEQKRAWEVAQYQAMTAAANTNAIIGFCKAFALTALLGGGALWMLTNDTTRPTRTTRRERRHDR